MLFAIIDFLAKEFFIIMYLELPSQNTLLVIII